MSKVYFETVNNYVIKVSCSSVMLEELKKGVYPLFKEVSKKTENLSIKITDDIECKVAMIKKYSLDQSNWKEYREGFNLKIKIKENIIGDTIALLHETGDVIIHNRDELVLYSKNVLAARYIMLDSYSRWMQNQGAVPMHASAVSYKDSGIMICGHKRAGKTTLTLNFLNFEGAKFIDNDKVLWHKDKIYCGNPAINILDEKTGEKVKSRGLEVYSALPNDTEWDVLANLNYIIILSSGFNRIDIKNAGDDKIHLIKEHIHDPWENWLKIYPNPVCKLEIPNNVEVLICNHGIKDELETCELLLEKIDEFKKVTH